MESVQIYTETQFSRDLKWDASFRILFMLKGDLQIHVGTSQRRLYTHDLTFIKPFELYGACTYTAGCRAYIISIAPELLDSICPNADKLYFPLSVLKANDSLSAYTSICKALAQISFFSITNERYSNARICRAVSDILAILIEDFSETPGKEVQPESSSDRVQNILRFISSNYARKISLEEIANEIGFHPQYFSAYFKKQFGTTFTDYLNEYRINKSTGMLADTQESILNIALACGFNNHKTFSNAFEKVYGCSPREWRKNHAGFRKDQILIPEEEDIDFFRRFWRRKESDAHVVQTQVEKCRIILDRDSGSYTRNNSHNIISIGRAMSCLRSDLQKQLAAAKKDLDLEFVRIRDVFSDDLFVFYEDNKTPVYSWRALDEVFDFLISIDVKPFIEIGYMPSQLASKKQYAGWQYHPNISAPKSLKQWAMLVNSFVTHLLQRYGRKRVESWLFDFWTSPNLEIQYGYWNESMEYFFHFYEITYNSLKEIDPNLKMGSPNFSYPSGMDWYRSFFRFAGTKHIFPDFISIHLYSCDDGQQEGQTQFMHYSAFEGNQNMPHIRPIRENISQALDDLRIAADQSGFYQIPIIIDDWNVTFFPTDYTRDTCFMGPYILENYFGSFRQVFGMGFASLSDIHEDFFNTDQPFNGGPGLLTYNGIPKAAYHALSMAYRFTRNIIKQESNYILGKTDNGYEILIYNMDFYSSSYIGNDPSVISFTQRYLVFEEVHNLDCHIELPVSEGAYSIVKARVSRSAGSAYDHWIKMGSPVEMNADMSQYLQSISTPEMNYQVQTVTGTMILDEMLEPHSILHIQINRL